MAIDKSRTSVGMKIVLIVVCVAFVASLVPVAFSGLFSQNQQSLNSKQPGAGTADAINAKFAASAQTFQTAVASDPTSYTALVNLGNTYLDWGGELVRAGQTQNSTSTAAAATPLLLGAKDAYEKALKVKKGEPAVEGDLAVALFYTGDVKGAIRQGEKVIKANPKYAVMWFNIGNFYRTDGQTQKAIDAYNQYLKLEPKGDRATAARKALSEMQAK